MSELFNTEESSRVLAQRVQELDVHAQHTTTQTTKVREAAAALASWHAYESTGDPRVVRFLLGHPEAVDTLRDVRTKLAEAFGPSIRPRLEPSEDDPDLLFVRIYNHGRSVEEAATFLEEQQDEWWWTLPTEKTAPLALCLGWELP